MPLITIHESTLRGIEDNAKRDHTWESTWKDVPGEMGWGTIYVDHEVLDWIAQGVAENGLETPDDFIRKMLNLPPLGA